MMQWRRLTSRSFVDALLVLSEQRWWAPGRSHRAGGKAAASPASAAVAAGNGRRQQLVRWRRPF